MAFIHSDKRALIFCFFPVKLAISDALIFVVVIVLTFC